MWWYIFMLPIFFTFKFVCFMFGIVPWFTISFKFKNPMCQVSIGHENYYTNNTSNFKLYPFFFILSIFFSLDFIGSHILEYIVYDLMHTHMLSRLSHVRLSVIILRTSAQPGSSVHGILQAGKLKWAEMPSSRESSWSRNWTSISCIAGGFYTAEPLGKPFS